MSVDFARHLAGEWGLAYMLAIYFLILGLVIRANPAASGRSGTHCDPCA